MLEAPRTQWSRTDRTESAHWYSLYGLRVVSEVHLPIPALELRSQQEPDVTIVYGDPNKPVPTPVGILISEVRCNEPCHEGEPVFRVHRGPAGAWFWNARLGSCHVSPEGRVVTVYPVSEADERTLGLMMLGQITIFILHIRGLPALHASSVVTEQGAIVFLGPKGQGKSTMAAAFLRAGARLLTDDMLPLQQVGRDVYGVPGPAIMKVWPATAEHTLKITHGLPDLMPELDKKLLTLAGDLRYAGEQAPLRAVYILARSERMVGEQSQSVMRTLSGHEAVAALLAQIPGGSCFALQEERVRYLPLVARLATQSPVRVLHYPNGFQYQQDVCGEILANLEQP